ncbi:MAG TPA: LysM peptidoglycan-binding domain-containing protein, partial [Rubricoccaceae bacterium]
AAPSRAQSVDARLADLRLATAVRLALVADASTRALDVDVTAEGGAVRLAGADTGAAERVARGVAGVRSVNGRGALGAALPPDGPLPAERVRTGPPRVEAPSAGAPRAEAPRAEAPRAEPAGPATHTVARGETLFSLARRYGTTVEALRRLNGLGPTGGIEVGRRLRLR